MNAAKILIVEDELLIARNLAKKLRKLGYEVVKTVSSGQDAMKAVSECLPDLILMDIAIKGSMDGIETAGEILRFNDIPIIYLTAYADDQTLERAAQSGGYGYILKPFKERELKATIKIALSNHQDQSIQRQTMSDVLGHYIAAASEDTSIYFDRLTNLPNQLALRDQFNGMLAAVNQRSTQFLDSREIKAGESTQVEEAGLLPVVCLNLDRFHRINQSLDRLGGDVVLQIVAQRLSDCVGSAGVVARLENDEFALLLPKVQDKEAVTQMTQAILDEVSKPMPLEPQEVFMTASLGVAFYPVDGGQIETLMGNARLAMQSAKKESCNQYHFYRSTVSAPAASENLVLETDLHYALQRNEFYVLYQPQFSLSTGKLTGVEALLRWKRSNGRLVSPARFIPLAEENGCITSMGEWVLKQACQQVQAWKDDGLDNIHMAVNLSGIQLKQRSLIQTLKNILSETGLDPNFLELELTEQVLVKDVETNIQRLNDLRDLGIKVAVDDFGTGYSSLSYLQQFPFDVLKIDRCFIKDINSNEKNAAITKALIQMAHQLGLKVVAEGVETNAELEFLQHHQCDTFQGYLMSPPISADDLFKFAKGGELVHA